MLSQLLKDKKKLKVKTLPRSQRAKGRRGSSSSVNTESENHSNSKPPKSSSEEGDNSESRSSHSKKMSKLEQCLEALANWDGLQDVGIVRPYLAEWDTTPYPPKFKALTLHTFDDIGSPNQHIYYFKSQTGNVVSNDAIMAHLFFGTLKGVTFEWFMKHPASSIKTWANLEKLFLARFFEDDTEISVPTLLVAMQKKGDSTKTFFERFQSMALCFPATWPSLHWSRHAITIYKLPYSLKWEWKNVTLERS